MARARPPRPQTIAKPEGRVAHPVADHGVFRVERLVYERTPLPRELLFIWQYRHGTDELSLEIPGGVIDPGEEPIEAARRELTEETGYVAESFSLLSVVEPNPALQGNRCHTYLARGAKPTGVTAFDDLEDLET